MCVFSLAVSDESKVELLDEHRGESLKQLKHTSAMFCIISFLPPPPSLHSLADKVEL